MYNIDVANQDITNNSIGATIPYVFSLGGQYSGIASCTIPMEDQAIYYSATASLLQQGSSPGYLKLNDYMDVKIEIYIRGQRMEYLPVPFNNESNQAYQNKCVPPTTQFNNFESGAQGRVTFMITKPIVNGVNLLVLKSPSFMGALGITAQGWAALPCQLSRLIPESLPFRINVLSTQDRRSSLILIPSQRGLAA